MGEAARPDARQIAGDRPAVEIDETLDYERHTSASGSIDFRARIRPATIFKPAPFCARSVRIRSALRLGEIGQIDAAEKYMRVSRIFERVLGRGSAIHESKACAR